MESESSDNEFKLNQKRRELQHLEDRLHMKSKDLKQKEFDITNAESPADISSSQLAELADRLVTAVQYIRIILWNGG